MSCGGFSEQPVDEEITKMAQFATPHLQKDINNTAFFKLKYVDKAEVQIVSGKKYRMLVTLGETHCKKDEHSHEEGVDCTLVDEGREVRCKVDVWDQPWTKHREVTDHMCGAVEFPNKADRM